MNLPPRATRARVWMSVGAAVLFVLAVWFLYHAFVPQRLPYADAFARNSFGEWHSYGGSWSIHDGSIRNISDERGSRLEAGDSRWRDYKLDVDLRFLGQSGDIGVVVRSNDDDIGVDAYNGYYVGLRMFDNSLIIGRADHGWMEIQPQHLPGGIHPLDWFHLTVVASGCKIAASAVDLRSGEKVHAGLTENRCVTSGRIGLRSLGTGGEWRNVRVAKATSVDLDAMSHNIAHFDAPSFPQSEAAYNSTHAYPSYEGLHGIAKANDGEPVSTLAMLKEGSPRRVIARGVVVLTSPVLYIEDASTGIAVYPKRAPLLNLGDEVEVTGTAAPGNYADGIHDATIHLLWDRAPLLPLSVTAAQAATGLVDGMLVEIPGHLDRVSRNDGKLTMTVSDGSQSFQAIISDGDINSLYQQLAPQSFLRLRGICVLDPHYTGSLSAFVLLLRSADDVTLIAGPPWWSKRHLMQIAIALLVLALIALFVYGRVEHWRLKGITQERVRLAHELHDTLAQSFAGLGFQLQGIRKVLHSPSADLDIVNRQLDAACDIVRSTHEEASLSMVLLREELPSVTDLAEALKSCASQIVFGGNIAVEVFIRGASRVLPMRITDALFHIGREAIVNAVRHGQPNHISIILEYMDRATLLRVEDDGCGFDHSSCRGMGLRGMERRAKAAALQLTINSSPGKGTSVQVEAPIEERHGATAWLRLKGRAWRLKLNER